MAGMALGKVVATEVSALLNRLYLCDDKKMREQILMSSNNILTMRDYAIKMMATRMQVDSGSSEAERKIKSRIASLASPTLGKIYREVVEISQRLHASKGTYKHNSFQCLMAAQLLDKNSPFKILKAAPGQGKTFVMILVAHYLL